MDSPIHPNNPTYMRLHVERVKEFYDYNGWKGVGLQNEGFKGIKMHPTINQYRVDSLKIMEPVMKLGVTVNHVFRSKTTGKVLYNLAFVSDEYNGDYITNFYRAAAWR